MRNAVWSPLSSAALREQAAFARVVASAMFLQENRQRLLKDAAYLEARAMEIEAARDQSGVGATGRPARVAA